MKELSFLFIGLAIGMLSPIQNKIYCLIPLGIGIIIYYIFELNSHTGTPY